MPAKLNQEELQEIAEQLAEYVAGYAGFMAWARGDIDLEETPRAEADFPWRPAFMVFAGKGRVEIYREILRSHAFPLDPFAEKTIEAVDQDLELWMDETFNRVAEEFEEAADYLIDVYRSTYRDLEKGKETGWCFDDFIEERDLLEFFLIGVGDRFPVTDLAVAIFGHDCHVRDQIAELGLEQYAAEYFPGRIVWYPARFWWHHPPEDRAPHPDSLES